MAPRVTIRWLEGGELHSGDQTSLQAARDAGGEVWIDVLRPDRDAFDFVSQHYRLHPLAVDDALESYQRPKIDLYWDLVYFVWVAPKLLPDDGLDMRKLDIFLGKRILITTHNEEWIAIDEVAGQAQDMLKAGVEWVLHGILDRAVDGVFPVVDGLSDTLESLEDAMLTRATSSKLGQLYGTKRLLVALRRIIGPERDVIRGLARQEMLVSQEAYSYFQDIGDHLARVEDTVDTYRDVAAGIMDIYLSSVSNRMNQIMKQLTIVATIFMPLTLISGIYGMNFQYLPELHWHYGYYYVLSLMVLITAGMLVFFKRRDWW